MKYKIVGNNNYEELNISQLESELLHRRGINDINKFLNVSKDNIENINNYDHMEDGYNLLKKHIHNVGEEIGLLVDCDTDGYSSSATMYQYLKDICPGIQITYFMHNGKEHGLTDKNILKKIKNSNIKLLIIPDAGSIDYIEHKELKEIGIDILVLDHHEAKKYSNDAVVINNQLSTKVHNKNLSGVGVVYKFCKYIDKKINKNFADKYLDLVALGNIADVIDLRELETRYLVLQGLKQINNQFLIELINRNAYEIDKKGINILSIGWVIIPKINAVIRTGTKQEKTDLFRAFIGEEETSERTYKGKTTIETLQQKMSRIATNKHNTQNNKVKKCQEEIENQITNINDKVLIINGTGILDNTLTGLVANKLANKYKRPILLLQKKKDEEDIYGGSARNYNGFAIQDFNEFCTNSHLFSMCEGHPNAFGIKINKNNINNMKKYANDKLKDVQLINDKVYVVDFAFNMKDLKKNSIVKDIGLLKDVWGNGIDEPYFVIKNVIISSKEIKQYGTKKNVVKFTVHNINFIKEYASQDFYDKITCKPERGFKREKILTLEILGKFQINNYKNKIQPQIAIIDYNIIKAEKPEDIF